MKTAAAKIEGAVRALSLNEEHLRALLEAAPDAWVIVDHGGRIVLVNAQTEQLFGYSREEMLHQPVEMLVPERYRAAHPGQRGGYFREPRVRPMGMGIELNGLRKDRSEFPVEISLSPLTTPEGLLVSATIRDVTERKRFQRALQDKNLELEAASRAKDKFLASMSHELRTPLNAILGFTGTLLMRLPGPLTTDQERQLRIVDQSGRHLLSLINDLLDLAKIESGKVELHPEPLDAAAALDEVARSLRPLAEAKRLTLEVRAPAGLSVRADRRALSQVLLNLANNAIKFTDAGGVRLEAARRAGADGAARVEVSVVDTGRGIREEDRARLFQAFSQVDGGRVERHEGTGLGLHISRRLAELMGATIGLAPSTGAGTTFTLTLPEA